ncbi:hypothetical protein GKZ67_21860 (plasmid) [Hymenobacter sp. BRD67]|nr:hypothetical protein GKZ67_21860 [Hymenobacter sp. BRD67]
MKLGYVTSSLLISKLQAYPRQHQLTTYCRNTAGC